MDTEGWSTTQLRGLLKATPEEAEARDLQAYLQVAPNALNPVSIQSASTFVHIQGSCAARASV